MDTELDARFNLAVDQGAAFDRTFVWRRGTGTPVNLTGRTAVMEVVSRDGGAPLLTLTQADGITLGGAAGTIKVHVDAADTVALEPTSRHPLLYKLTVTGGSPFRTARIASGYVTVSAQGSRGKGIERLVDRKDAIVEVFDTPDMFTGPFLDGYIPLWDEAQGAFVMTEPAAGGDGGVALAAHVAAADPHTGYQKESEKAAANGYASLDGSGVVPDVQIPAAIARDSEVTSAVAAEATARTSAIAAAVAAILNSAPGALDTLDELAAALGDDANFAATVTTTLAGKQPLDSDLTAIAALSTTSFGRSLLALADAAALLSAAGAAPVSHGHAGEDVTSGTVADARIAATIARDSEVTSAISALSSVYQPLDSDLTAVAALTTTSFGRSLLAAADAAALRTLVGLVIGTDVPALSATVLKSLFDANTVLAATTDDTPAALTMGASTILARLAAGNIKAASVAELITLLQAYSIGGTDVAVADGGTGSSTAGGALTNLGVSSFVQTILDDADAAAVRTTIGAGAGTSVATDAIFDAKGDLAVGTGADTAAKLTAGANGKVPTYQSGQATGLLPQFPPGYEWDYKENATTVSTTQTVQASAVTLVASNSVTYDGTAIMIHFFCGYIDNASFSSGTRVTFWEDSTDLGIVIRFFAGANGDGAAQSGFLRWTPSAGAHVYTAKMFVSGSTGSAYGSSQSVLPMFIRVLKA